MRSLSRWTIFRSPIDIYIHTRVRKCVTWRRTRRPKARQNLAWPCPHQDTHTHRSAPTCVFALYIWSVQTRRQIVWSSNAWIGSVCTLHTITISSQMICGVTLVVSGFDPLFGHHISAFYTYQYVCFVFHSRHLSVERENTMCWVGWSGECFLWFDIEPSTTTTRFPINIQWWFRVRCFHWTQNETTHMSIQKLLIRSEIELKCFQTN